MTARRWLFAAGVTALLCSILTLSSCRSKPIPAPDVGKAKEEEEPPGPVWFSDITKSAGIHFAYRNGEDSADHLSILESLGGGVGLLDFDGDGLIDVFLPGGGHFSGKDKKDIVGSPCKLYRNLGNSKFQEVTAAAGLDRLAGGQPWFYTHGVAVGDYDRDGWPDLLVTGWRRIALFRNVPVDPNDPKKGRRFEDVSAAAKLDKAITWGTSAAWGDLDGDGYPDLYVCEYVDWSWENNPPCSYGAGQPGQAKRDVCPPAQFSGLKHKVFRNNADGTFTDQTEAAGLLPGGREASKGLGVIMVDFDGDGKPDVYVCNDTVDNFLYLNVSKKPGEIRFAEKGMASGTARDDGGRANGSMGVDVGDYDRSGKASIWVTNYENELHALYRNECRPGSKDKESLIYFNFQTQPAGIAALKQVYVGWGTAFLDFDLDGWEDLFVANGHAIRYPIGKGVTRKQRPVLMLNVGGKYKSIRKRLGEYGEQEHLSRGVGFGDLDNDGRGDMIVSHMNDPVSVLRNIAGEGQHWLGVELVGKKHACTVGSKVVLEADGVKQTRFGKSGGSYCSSGDRRMVFGLGKAKKIDTVTITWPDGSTQEVKDLVIDRYHKVMQPEK